MRRTIPRPTPPPAEWIFRAGEPPGLFFLNRKKNESEFTPPPPPPPIWYIANLKWQTFFSIIGLLWLLMLAIQYIFRYNLSIKGLRLFCVSYANMFGMTIERNGKEFRFGKPNYLFRPITIISSMLLNVWIWKSRTSEHKLFFFF